MKIAVTCEDGKVFQHFGHTSEFAVFDIENGAIVSESRKSSGESGHGALAELLAGEEIDLLICGGIGGGALSALVEAGVAVVGGASGGVRDVVERYLAGTLIRREDYRCAHHDNEAHSCTEEHHCGNTCTGN